jgi:hypothetical protein
MGSNQANFSLDNQPPGNTLIMVIVNHKLILQGSFLAHGGLMFRWPEKVQALSKLLAWCKLLYFLGRPPPVLERH